MRPISRPRGWRRKENSSSASAEIDSSWPSSTATSRNESRKPTESRPSAQATRQHEVAEQRQRRAEQLEDDEVRHRDQPERAVARVQRQPAVAPERLGEAALPAPPLAREHRQRLGRLRPADRDPGRTGPGRAGPARAGGGACARRAPCPRRPSPCDQPPTASTVARRNSPNAPEMISSARSLLQPTRPTRNARKYSTTWSVASRLAGSAHVDDAPVLHAAAVGDPHDAAGRDRPGRGRRAAAWRRAGAPRAR